MRGRSRLGVELSLLLSFTAACGQANDQPPFAIARAVCGAVADGVAPLAGDNGGLPLGDAMWERIDINNDGEPDNVRVEMEGSSATETIWVDDPDGLTVAPSPADGDMTPLGSEVRLIEIDNRTYHVRYNRGWRDEPTPRHYPVYVAYQSPDNTINWLCTFEAATPPPVLAPVEGRPDAPEICDYVEAQREATHGNLRFAPMPASVPALTYSESQFSQIAAIDFMNEGEVHTILKGVYSSGAGAGCETNFFALQTPAQHPDAASLLERLQSPNKPMAEDALNRPVTADGGMVACRGNAARFHSIDRRVMLEQRFPDPSGPKSKSQEFWWVTTVENGEVITLCEATTFTPQSRVAQYNTEVYPRAQ